MAHDETASDTTPDSGPEAAGKDSAASSPAHEPSAAPAPESAQALVEGHSHGTVEPSDSGANTPAPSNRVPPAGPHADPKLMNDIATPGTGALTPTGTHDDVDSTSS
jgi:hypothetical protein